MESNPGSLFSDASTDLEDSQLDRVEVGLRPPGASHAGVLQGVEQHVGDAVQEEPELVCLKSMTGGPV